MERVSPYTLCKQLEKLLQSKISSLDLPSLPHAEQAVITSLRQAAIDARLSVRDYEFADSLQEQLEATQEAKVYLEQVKQDMLAASQFGVFGPVDVAHLSATIEQITESIR